MSDLKCSSSLLSIDLPYFSSLVPLSKPWKKYLKPSPEVDMMPLTLQVMCSPGSTNKCFNRSFQMFYLSFANDMMNAQKILNTSSMQGAWAFEAWFSSLQWLLHGFNFYKIVEIWTI